MNDVVNFPTPANHRDWILKCSCGCLSFDVHINHGFFTCTNCGTEFEDDLPGCEKRSRQSREVDPDPDDHRVHHFPDNMAGFRRTLERASEDPTNVAAIVVMLKDGTTCTWSEGYEGEEQEQWFQSRVDDLMRALK